MNSKNSKTSHLHRLLLNLSDKINLKRGDKYVSLSNFSIPYTWKNIKKSYKNNKFKIYLKKHGEKTDNPTIRIYVNTIENRIMFKTKA